MFFPSQRSDFSELRAKPRAGPGQPPPSVKPSRKIATPQKSPLRLTPSKSNLFLKRPSSSASRGGSRPTSVASSVGMGRGPTVVDNRPPPPSSEELVTRLFKGLGVPLYEPRIPATYQQEIVSSALKDYRWGAFDLSIYHDTMLTIAKPPPTPPAPVVEAPPLPPVEDTVESPLLITNASEPEPSVTPRREEAKPIEPVVVPVQPSAKTRLISQKVQPSSKASFSTKMSTKAPTESRDFKEGRSVKRGHPSTKGLSIKTSVPNSPESETEQAPEPAKLEDEAPIVVESVEPVPPALEPVELGSVEEPPRADINSDIESEQLIDGLLDLSLAYSTAAAGYATNLSHTPKAIKIPDSSMSSKTKSVKSPTSFLSSLMSSLSTKVVSAVTEGKSTKSRKNIDFAALGLEDPDSLLAEEAEAPADTTDAQPSSVEESTPVETTEETLEAPVETLEPTEETEDQFNFLSEAAQLAAEVASEEQVEEQQEGSPVDVLQAPVVTFSPESKQQPYENKIISPAERSVFKPTFAMPRPPALQQDPIAALLVSDLQGGKRFSLQTETSQSVDGPLSGPKSKRKRNSFGSLEEIGMEGDYPRLPAKAGKLAAELLESDTESEFVAAQAQVQAQQQGQVRKTKKEKKQKERGEPKELNFAKLQLGPDGEPAKPKPQKQPKASPSPAKLAKQWYMAGAYSSHHEAIDAINRMHKLLASQSPHKHGDETDLDDTFRLQRDLSRMQWVVECNDMQQKALILSHATRSPVVPEKDKSKYRNIMSAIKEPAPQGPGAALYHSPTQLEKHHDKQDKHGDEMYLRERDAFHEQHLRQVKAQLPKEDTANHLTHHITPHAANNSSPPPRQLAEGGSRFPPIAQAQQAQGQAKKTKKGK